MPRSRLASAVAFSLAFAAALSFFSSPASAQAPAAKPPYEPEIKPASDEGKKAIARFRVPAGLKVELFAAEPLLANPVAFWADDRGRFYVAETFRHSDGVTDTRSHMNWLDDDLACRTVADRVAMYRKFFTPKQFSDFSVAHDRLRRIEDRDGDGVADAATVFADGFNNPAVGIGAGVLARGDDVYFACIPDLWLLRDANGDGVADERSTLHTGYGVHVGFLGHDLHGLTFGPDGKLYFSIGDRGFNVQADGKGLAVLDSGSILRCNPDGSELEVVATGLRNPQELAFDPRGDLFTVDNNSDSGDKARLVHLVEGGDSGWRIGYQFIENPTSRGPWNEEKLWVPGEAEKSASILPPLANLSDGPSGLTRNPGVTALPDRYKDHFFLADFRGSGTSSGIRAFTVKPKGASFELAESEEFLWGVEVTDVDFAPDGSLYFSDWVEGWNKTGKGRLYRVFDPALKGDAKVAEVRTILADGFDKRSPDELAGLLAHADMRVRQKAQFALAAKGAGAIQPFTRVARESKAPLARLHAIWGLGQVGRREASVHATLADLLTDADPEVRAQAAKTLGDDRAASAGDRLVPLLADANPRVRFFAAIALGRMGRREAAGPLVEMARKDGDDAYLRHAAVMGLIGAGDLETLARAAKDDSANVRLASLLAYRRLGRAEVATFLGDKDARLVLEAARAIHDQPIAAAFPALAALAGRKDLPSPIWRRVVAANSRVGGADGANALAAIAARQDVPESVRVEAIDALRNWAKPTGRDAVVGLWRPIADRPAVAAAAALKPVLDGLLKDSSSVVQKAATRAAGSLADKADAEALRKVLADVKKPAEVRVEVLRALEQLGDAQLADLARHAVDSPETSLRAEGLRVLAKVRPKEAVPALERALDSGVSAEQQAALATLGDLADPAADVVLARWLDLLAAGKVAPEVQLDVIEAAARRPSSEVKDRLGRIEAGRPKDDPVAAFREALAGGDPDRGRRIFFEKAEVQCVRCHKVGGQGGDVGPDLSGVGGRQPREYLLESIVAPDRKIAEGFETLVVATADGQVQAGILKSEAGDALKLMTPEGKLVTISKDDVEERKRGASAMPADLTKSLSRSEVRDLVAYLANQKPGSGDTPESRPEGR
ncbi:MAG: HEAT repeat domain-containing protein [Paludisphaera borealis]|uniref:PVC-type heme-binding CxxCH protein n=1 Tax=Paludisphaera borealis TaxID=1387353 RepID=UPI00283DEA1C|nr:PVC-type heme-binding CxxCH protein [Paludisphaera borealis]MDR3622322.1 HEAT repeat domain-containing protein [Paludisphaera borealis]